MAPVVCCMKVTAQASILCQAIYLAACPWSEISVLQDKSEHIWLLPGIAPSDPCTSVLPLRPAKATPGMPQHPGIDADAAARRAAHRSMVAMRARAEVMSTIVAPGTVTTPLASFLMSNLAGLVCTGCSLSVVSQCAGLASHARPSMHMPRQLGGGQACTIHCWHAEKASSIPHMHCVWGCYLLPCALCCCGQAAADRATALDGCQPTQTLFLHLAAPARWVLTPS